MTLHIFNFRCCLIVGAELLCYVHNVTPVHNSGKVKYTTCQLQTSENALVKAICFPPDKNKPLKSAMQNRSPIKLTKFEYNKKLSNVVIKNNSSVTIQPDALPFKINEALGNQVFTMDSLQSTAPQQLVTIKATVSQISGTKTIKLENKTLPKSSAILVDPTGSISGFFWEEWADKLEVNKTYVFKNLRVKIDNYTKQLYVNTAKDGFGIETAPDFEEELAEVEPTVMEMTMKEALISIIGIKNVSSYYACGKKAEATGTVLKCDACKMKQKVIPESKQWYVKLFVQNETSKEKFNLMVFNQHLSKIIEANGKVLNDLTEDEIGDTLLEVENVSITYNIIDNKLLQVNM